MLPCIVCSKQVDEDASASDGGTPKFKAEKDGLKSLTHQLKDMVLKASIAYRQCKPGSAAIFDDDPPSFDELGRRELVRSISKRDASSRSINSQEPDRAQDSHGRSPKSPGSSAYLRIVQQQVASEKHSVEEDAGQEWVAQVEPGVLISFLTLPNGSNELKRIRFSRNVFTNGQAEAWWTANSEKVHELYNVSGKEKLPATLPNLQSSKEVKSPNEFGIGASPANSPRLVGDSTTKPSMGATQSLNIQNAGFSDVKNEADAATISSASGNGSEYLTEDEPGVYITVKVLPGGIKALKRIRFSCDKFDELQAKLWWEQNRFRIHEQYVREPTHGTSFTNI